MIDPTLPLELDDGTPVTLMSHTQSGATVKIPCSPTRADKTARYGWHRAGIYSYSLVDGHFFGGSPKDMLTLRNSGPAEPEEYESWFQ